MCPTLWRVDCFCRPPLRPEGDPSRDDPSRESLLSGFVPRGARGGGVMVPCFLLWCSWVSWYGLSWWFRRLCGGWMLSGEKMSGWIGVLAPPAHQGVGAVDPSDPGREEARPRSWSSKSREPPRSAATRGGGYARQCSRMLPRGQRWPPREGDSPQCRRPGLNDWLMTDSCHQSATCQIKARTLKTLFLCAVNAQPTLLDTNRGKVQNCPSAVS